MYYVITVCYRGIERQTTLKIDEHELYTFIELITEHLNDLDSFKVVRHYTVNTKILQQPDLS